MRCASCKFWGWNGSADTGLLRPCRLFSESLEPPEVRLQAVESATVEGHMITGALFSCVHWQAGISVKPEAVESYKQTYMADHQAYQRVAPLRLRDYPADTPINESIPIESSADPVTDADLATIDNPVFDQDGERGYRAGQWK